MTVKQNIEDLQDRLKYSGFGESLHQELEKQVKSGKSEIELHLTKDPDNKKLDYHLHFRKSEEGRYFYNGFDATLTHADGRELSQRFYHNQGISAKEAFNLLEGRAVFKSLFNREGERYNAWLQLDLRQKDDKGQHPVKQYHQNYGFDLEKEVTKLPIASIENPDQKDLLFYSLKKGNLHSVELEDREGRFHLEANPRFKSLNLYDASGKRLAAEGLSAKQDQDSKAQKKPAKAQKRTRARKYKGM